MLALILVLDKAYLIASCAVVLAIIAQDFLSGKPLVCMYQVVLQHAIWLVTYKMKHHSC